MITTKHATTLKLWIIAIVCLPAIGSTSLHQSHTRAANDDMLFEQLCATILDNPSDPVALQQLDTIRIERQQSFIDGLDALITGLNAILDGDDVLAATALSHACDNRRVAELADRYLLESVEDLAKKSADPHHRCPTCHGCGKTVCRDCLGSTWSTCPLCSGKGKIFRIAQAHRRHGGAHATSHCRTCPRCTGLGVVRCNRCSGTGIERCDRCLGVVGSGKTLGPESREAIRQAIAVAELLRQGALDIYTPTGLSCSPKLTE
jgi:hypothetical protein